MSLGTAMLWIGLGDPGGDFSAPNSLHSLMQNLSLVHILVLTLPTDIKRNIYQRWKVIPQKMEIIHLSSQPAPTGHVYLATMSIFGSRSACFWGILQTWVDHHSSVGDSPLAEQSSAHQLSGERRNWSKPTSPVRQIILGLVTFVCVLMCSY